MRPKKKIDDKKLKLKLKEFAKDSKIDLSSFTKTVKEIVIKEIDQSLLFDYFDRNGDGYISFGELQKCMKDLQIQTSLQDVERMIKSADQNKDGNKKCIFSLPFFFLIKIYLGKVEKKEFQNMCEIFKDNLPKK